MATGRDSRLRRLKALFFDNRKIILTWLAIGGFVAVVFATGLDKRIAALGVLVFAFFTQAFTGLLGLIALIPLVGPLLVKVVTLPFFLLVNGLAYLVTLFAVKRGARDVMKSRVLVSSFLVGIVVGFILGRLL